jgi:hypothetical protein
MCPCQRLQDAVPDAGPSPANEPIVASGAGTIDVWEVPPGSARTQHPEDAIEHAPIIDAGYAARFGREQRTNDAPLVIGKFITHGRCSRLEAFHASGSWAEAKIETRVMGLHVLTRKFSIGKCASRLPTSTGPKTQARDKNATRQWVLHPRGRKSTFQPTGHGLKNIRACDLCADLCA